MPRVVHFEVYVEDVDRASKFYGEVFGWTVTKMELDGGAALLADRHRRGTGRGY